MSGPLGSSQWMYASGGFYPYNIGQSLRFNDNDSAYLSRTPASAGDGGTWTWSGWVKRGNINLGQVLFGCTVTEGVAYTIVNFSAGNTLNLTHVFGGVVQWSITTSAVFRDPSAWYHIVAVADTDNATQVDRIRLYVNGVRQSVTGVTLAALSASSFINSVNAHAIGRYGTSQYFDGYMAEVNFIDGTALDPTSFGEFKSGVWVPKRYTGSYGTNGFYLSFADSAAIGDDLSGNANDWTPSGLASTDVLLDSPTNNYAVLNPITPIHTVLSDGNLQSGTGDTWSNSTIGMSSGKWYAEFTLTTFAVVQWFGVGQNAPITGYNGQLSLDYSYAMNGMKYNNNVGAAYGATYTSGDVIGVAFDADAGELTFYKNGVSQGVAYSGMPAGVYYFQVYGRSSGGSTVAVANFGQLPFAYTPPAVFLALNTANLPDPAIDPAQDDVPADYFDVALDTGANIKTSAEALFTNQLEWIKDRANANNHQLIDSVRGLTAVLQSNTTAAETTYSAPSGNSVGWVWRASDSAAASNTDGTISSTVSANQKVGFSIVDYAGTISGSPPSPLPTVGHGLAAAPKLVISKSKNNGSIDSGSWFVWHEGAGTGNWFRLNTTDAALSVSGSGGGTMVAPTTSVFSTPYISGSNVSGATYIAYCFAEVDGYSKFGSYTGNGSADGPFAWCGFRPAFVVVKRTSATGNWTILDDAREGYNVDNDPLYPNLSNAEGTTDLADLLSNGFKLRTTDASVNASGGTYIFSAFASMPFKFSGGR